jgi:signal peptidase
VRRAALSLVGRLGLWLAVVCAIALFGFLVIGPRLGYYRTLTVLSNSMQPTWSAGDVVVDTPEPLSAVRVGQAITFQAPIDGHALVTHRVIQVVKGGAHPVVRTQGDANPTPDAWTAKLENGPVWRARLVVPKLGWALFFLHDRLFHVLTMIVVPLLLAATWLIWIWRPRSGSPDGDLAGGAA